MKLKSVFLPVLTALFMASASFGAGGPPEARSKSAWPSSARDDIQLARAKGLLLELVRQDGYLDGAAETLSARGANLSAHDISALSLRLKTIRLSLDGAAESGKTQFSEVHPGMRLSPFTRAIFSYSSKMGRKISHLETLAARLGAQSAKETMRDSLSSASSSRGGEKIKMRGKNIARLLDEQRAAKRLSSDIKKLKRSSSKLTATARWLYIISK